MQTLEPPAATAADAEFVFREWHDRARRRDVAALIDLYEQDATLESPLVPRLMGGGSGSLQGRDRIGAFLERGTERRPDERVRWWRTGLYLFDGRTLMWEYPREFPGGEQVDIAEVMVLRGPRIAAHRIYWGWAGTALLAGG